jgi:hypothetical protein
MSLIKLAGKLPKEVATIFHDLVLNGMEKGYAARKAWGVVRQNNIEVTPVIKTVAKTIKKIDNGIQGTLFNLDDYR